MRSLAALVDGLVEGKRGTLVQRQKDRSVWRVEEGAEVWFAKRGVTPKRRRELRREVENARVLARMDLGPPVLQAGAHQDAEWLVTLDARSRGAFPLHFALRLESPGRLMACVGAQVRELHHAGIAFPDLTAWHVFVNQGRLWLIDSARLVRHRGPVPLRARARDAAAMLFSVHRGTVKITRTDRVRFLRTACGSDRDALREFCGLVDRELDRLLSRTRWRWEHWVCNEEFREAFLASARESEEVPEIGMDSILDRRNWRAVRTLPDRQNRSFPIDAECPSYFAKYYPARAGRTSPSLDELAGIDLFQRAGILVNLAGAHVEDRSMGSLVAVKAARGEPLDDLLRRGVSVAERRALAVQTARIWRRMRECGLRHRDAYPCHLFVAGWEARPVRAASGAVPVFGFQASAWPSIARGKTSETTNDQAEAWTPNEGTRFELRLIDMTRAGKAPFPKERWFIKDAAALWHGLPKPPVTRTDAVRWLREYFRIDRLDARAKRFARRVAAKEARIAARQARKKRK